MYFSYQWYVLNIFKNFKYAKALTFTYGHH